MAITYNELPEREKEQLLKFPAYVSLLAASYHNHGMDEKEEKTAIHFIHVRTYQSDPVLTEFFSDAEKEFEENLIQLNHDLPREKVAREAALRREMSKLEEIVSTMDSEFGKALHESMLTYREHVAHANKSLLEYLVFPIPIKGLNY
jgi:hypothetical protein